MDEYNNQFLKGPDGGAIHYTELAEDTDSYRYEVLNFRKYLEEHPKRNPRRAVAAGMTNTRLRWACKAGLEYPDFFIHFVLRGIDQRRVVQKEEAINEVGEYSRHVQKRRDITGSELRWLFRNRTNTDVQRRVQFWDWNRRQQRYVPCLPPWNTAAYRHLWASYVPRSGGSLRQVSGGSLRQVKRRAPRHEAPREERRRKTASTG
ncbi:MAG: hypothetical protein AAF355_09050 [Myxococcota bacterium]